MKKILTHNSFVKRGSLTLKPLSLTFEKGEIFAILGRIGSRKTVLLEVIGGMFPDTGGSIQHDGVDVMDTPPRNRRLDFVYQDHGLFLHMKVCDNISHGPKVHGFSKEEQRKRILDLMGMLSIIHIKNQYLGTLNGGESRRTALAGVLALESEVLLLDEPFSVLNPATREQFYLKLTRIYEYFRCTIIFVTHGFMETRLLAYRVGILPNGELEAAVPSDRLTDEYYCEEVEQFLGRE